MNIYSGQLWDLIRYLIFTSEYFLYKYLQDSG